MHVTTSKHTYRLNSLAHVGRTERGHTTKYGPVSPVSCKCATKEMTCNVFPSPISSPRMPPMPNRCCFTIHLCHVCVCVCVCVYASCVHTTISSVSVFIYTPVCAMSPFSSALICETYVYKHTHHCVSTTLDCVSATSPHIHARIHKFVRT